MTNSSSPRATTPFISVQQRQEALREEVMENPLQQVSLFNFQVGHVKEPVPLSQ